MRLRRAARLAALPCALALLAGCAAFRTADRELDTASRQLATGNITLSANDAHVPKAEITPQGNFLIAGNRIALTPQQHQEVSSYRMQYIAIAQQGIAIGKQGVDAGRRAVVPVVFEALFGASDDKIEASMDKRLTGVRRASVQLCARLPRLMTAQQQLADDLPAFRPYATLTRKKIDDCRDDVLKSMDFADK